MSSTREKFACGMFRWLVSCAVILSLSQMGLFADTNVTTNWLLNSTYTVADPNNQRVVMDGWVTGGGKLVVNNPNGLVLGCSSNDWTGGIEIKSGFVDPRSSNALGWRGSVLIRPDFGKTASVNLGLNGSNIIPGTFTNDFIISNVGLEETDMDVYPADSVPSSIKVGHINGNTASAWSQITVVGSIESKDGPMILQCGESKDRVNANYHFRVDGDVKVPLDSTLYLRTWGDFFFNGALTAKRLFLGMAWSQNCTVHLNSEVLDVALIELYSSNLQLMENCPESLPPLHWCWSWDSARYKVDVNGRSFNTPCLTFTEQKGAMQRFFSTNSGDSCSRESGGPSVGNSVKTASPWFTITGEGLTKKNLYDNEETECVALVRFIDNVSLRVDATNSFKQTLRLLPSTTKGELDVNRGKLRIEAPCSFKNITSIRVGKDGVLETVLTNCPAPFEAYGISTVTNFLPYGGHVVNMYNSVTNLEVNGRFLMDDLAEADPLPNLQTLTLSPDARLELPSGISLRVKHYIRYNARSGQYEEQPSDIYHPSEMVRGGSVIVDSGDTVECIWTGTNSNYGVDFGPNWKGYSGNDTPLLRPGLASPTFAEAGSNAWFSGNVTLRGLTFKAPANVRPGFKLMREPGANGRNAVISLASGGLSVKDDETGFAARHRYHEIEFPVMAYQSQNWNICNDSSVFLRGGFSDDGMHGVHVSFVMRNNASIALFGTNSLSAGSALDVTRGKNSNNGCTLAITGTVHLAGAMVASNCSVNVKGRIAGYLGNVNLGIPICMGDGTFTYSQVGAENLFTLDNAEIDVPMWMQPCGGGSLFYLTKGGVNFIRSPMMVQSRSAADSATIFAEDGVVNFEDQMMATNCIVRTNGGDLSSGRVIFCNRRVGENGGNKFLHYSPNCVTEFNCQYNTFCNSDYGGMTFGNRNSKVKFNVDLAVTNGTLRFNSQDEKNVYASFCDLGSTSQRIDRLVALHRLSNNAVNTATLFGDGAWLEIAGNGMSSTNGMNISNCVNIVKTGSAGLLFYDRDFTHTGDLVVMNGLMEFATNATWMTSSRVVVDGPGRLKLDASERLSPHVSLKLGNTYDPYDNSITNLWGLVLPAGVTQSVASVMRDGSMLQGGYLGNTNENKSGIITWHDDRIEGAGVIKIARRGCVFRFR